MIILYVKPIKLHFLQNGEIINYTEQLNIIFLTNYYAAGMDLWIYHRGYSYRI